MNTDDVLSREGATLGEASIGQVLLYLDQAKAEIIRELQSRTDELREESQAMRRDVIERLAAMNRDMKSAVLTVSRTTGSRSYGTRRGTPDGKRRRVPDADDVPYLGIVADKDNAALPLMRCTMMLTVFSFTHAFPQAESWVTDRLRENMTTALPLLDNVSGFSLIFFSVAADDLKTRFKSRMGMLWSWLCTSTVVVMLMSARFAHFDADQTSTEQQPATRIPLPPWFASFGGVKKATTIVADVVECLEQTGQTPLARVGKKMRRDDESSVSVDDPRRGEREQAVRCVRSCLLRSMSTGRTEARMHIFRSFLFLVEKIRTFPTVGHARAAGYEISFNVAESDLESKVPENLDGTIWSIPRACTEKCKDGDLEDGNSESFQDLAKRFPSLSVRLRYRKLIKRCPQASEDVSSTSAGTEQYWDVGEDLSLHRVALGVLVGMFRAKSFQSVLTSSSLSLRTVHIFAIALRGLIRRGLSMPLSPLETVALGDVSVTLLDKNEESATVMLGTRNDKAKESNEKTSLDKERELKFEMNWSAYTAAKRKRDEESRAREISSRSSFHQADEEGEESDNDDFDVSWIT